MLPGVIESRNKAHLAGAASLGEDFTDVEEQFLDLSRAIEDNNIRYTQKNMSKVSDAYLALELRAIKADSIGKVRPVIAQAIDEKAEKYVPKSLALAKKSIDDADAFITGNRYAKEAIAQKVQESLFLAQRAGVLNTQSQAIEKMQPEEIALLDGKKPAPDYNPAVCPGRTEPGGGCPGEHHPGIHHPDPKR